MDDLIDKLLESLWLQDRLSHNTLQSYRRDLVKVAARLAEGGQDWLSADEFALSDAVYAEGEKNTSQARALSACKRMYGWLEETGQRADNPTRFLKAPKSERKLPTLITEPKSTRCWLRRMWKRRTVCATKPCLKSCMQQVCA